MRDVIALDGLSRPDWLRARRQGIGSSDAAAIMGIDPWRGPLDVYVDKTRTDEPSENGDDLMRLGQLFEGGIGQAYAERNGATVVAPTHMVGHDDIPWLLASPDFWTTNVVDGDGVLECKMAHRFAQWDAGPLEHYVIQALHQLAVTGKPYADLAVLLGGRELREYRVEYDEPTIDGLIAIESAFWHDHVLAHVPPAPDEKSATALRQLYPGGAGEIELDPMYGPIIASWREAKANTAAAQRAEAMLENEIRAALGDHETGTLDGKTVVTWKASTRSGLDVKSLERDHGALLKPYRTSTPTRTLLLKKAK